MRCAAAIGSLLLCGGLPANSAIADDLWRFKPAIQIGGHLETGEGVLPGSGFAVEEQGGGVALALSFTAPVRPRLVAGVATELSLAHASIATQLQSGTQKYSAPTVRVMARLELWNRSPFDRERRDPGFYGLLGAGWNFNSVGTTITYVYGPPGVAGDLHLDDCPAFELGGGIELLRKRNGALFVEATWVYNAGSYQLEVFGETDRPGHFDLSGVTILLGLHFNPAMEVEE